MIICRLFFGVQERTLALFTASPLPLFFFLLSRGSVLCAKRWTRHGVSLNRPLLLRWSQVRSLAAYFFRDRETTTRVKRTTLLKPRYWSFRSYIAPSRELVLSVPYCHTHREFELRATTWKVQVPDIRTWHPTPNHPTTVCGTPFDPFARAANFTAPLLHPCCIAANFHS